MNVKLFYNKDIINNNHIELLIPELGFENMNKGHPQYGRFERFRDNGKEYIEYVKNPEDSDYFLYPIKWQKDSDSLSRFLNKADRFNKKTIIIFNDDSPEDMKLSNRNVAVFRTSFYNSKKNKNEFSIPGWSPDIGVKYFRAKSQIPVIGFCGCFNNNEHRFLSIQNLFKCNNIVKNFKLHNHFWGGWSGKTDDSDIDYAKNARKKFNENIVESDYTLCCRGAGNFSYRLYETLSAGRIPIIINTDIVLPHEDIIKWKDISIWVETKDIEKLSDIVKDFHDNISKEEFLKMQKKCRDTYEKYIRTYEFFKVWFEKDLKDIK